MSLKFLGKTTLVTLALMCALDAWLSLAHPLANLPTVGLDRSEIFNAVRAYRQRTKSPDIVLLGSSLVTAPFMQAEAELKQAPVARMTERESVAFQNCLASRLGLSPDVFCLAVGGEMVSDAYLIARNEIFSSRPPAAIVYGIAPRDFQDNLLRDLVSTQPFQLLSDVGDLRGMLSSETVSFERKMSLCLERVWALWRYRSDIRTYFSLRAKKVMEATMPWIVFDKYGETLDLKPRKRGWFPEEAKGVLRAWPGVALDHLSAEATMEEYRRRYNPVNAELIAEENTYLRRFLHLCKEKGVAVLMVNMPLSAANKKLMAPGFYDDYLRCLSLECSKCGVEFVNLDDHRFDKADNFVDTVHLTPQVSHKFLEALADVFAGCRVAQALSKDDAALAIDGHNRAY